MAFLSWLDNVRMDTGATVAEFETLPPTSSTTDDSTLESVAMFYEGTSLS